MRYKSCGSECIGYARFPAFPPFNAPHMELAPLMTSDTNEAAGRPGAPPLPRASEPERSQPDENAEQVTSCCKLVVAASLMFRYVCHASFNPLLLPNFPRAFRAEDRKQQSQWPRQCSVAKENALMSPEAE